MKKRIRNVLIILFGSAAAGSLLLMLTFLLPVDSARRHAAESLYEMIEVKEDPNGDGWRKRIVSVKDNFTDCLMVQNALERVEGQGPWAHAMYIFHHDLGDDTTWMTEKSLTEFVRRGSEGMYLKEYSKYWHGYLVYLKPLLMCMSWKHVETFLAVFQILLLLAAAAVSCYRRKAYLGLGILVTFLFMKPLRIWFSLTLSDCWSITLAAVIVLMLFYDKIERKNWREEVFLLIGILTAYIDFLTYPIVTLGVPLCVWLALSGETAWKKQLSKTFWNCACWAAGYLGMWGMKWVIAEITCQTGTLRNAAWSIIYRTSPLDGYASVFSGVSRTFGAVLQQYDSVMYGIGFGILAAAALVSGVWCLIKARSADWGISMVCLGAAALFPMGWLILTQNHTAIHCEFTFRIVGVTVMALWCMTVSSVRTIRKRAKENGIQNGIGQK